MTILVSSITGLYTAKAQRFEDLAKLNPDFSKEELKKTLEQLVSENKIESFKHGDVAVYTLSV